MCDKAKDVYRQYVCVCGKEFETQVKLSHHKTRCKVFQIIKKQKEFEERESRRLSNGMFKCENPGCQKEHDGKYGSGRFCSKKCRLSFIAKEAYKTKVKNGTFISGFFDFNKKNRSPYGTWKCEKCNLIFDTRSQLEEHNREKNHTFQIIQISTDIFKCPYCDYIGNKKQVSAHLFSCKNHPDKEKHDISHKKAGKTLSEHIKIRKKVN